VGLVLVPRDFDWGLIPGVNDSKKLSEKKREEIYELAMVLQKSGQLTYVVEMVSAAKIDKEGISACVKKAIEKGLSKLSSRSFLKLGLRVLPGDVFMKLDGSLKAPAEYVHQETIIKGDSKEKEIGLASIMAKVTRDRYMVKLAKQSEFAVYDFARHKGYGTKKHRTAIAQNGLSTEHRRTYCGNINVVL
jgi:ribonuclease HII